MSNAQRFSACNLLSLNVSLPYLVKTYKPPFSPKMNDTVVFYQQSVGRDIH